MRQSISSGSIDDLVIRGETSRQTQLLYTPLGDPRFRTPLISCSFTRPVDLSVLIDVVPTDVPVGLTSSIHGWVEWRTNKALHNAEIDLKRGIALSLFADHIEISSIIFGPVPCSGVNISASIVDGRIRREPSTCTTLLVNLGAGNTSNPLEIPPYARQLRVYSNPITALERIILEADPALQLVNASAFDTLDIPAYCRWARIVNGTANVKTYLLVYELYL